MVCTVSDLDANHVARGSTPPTTVNAPLHMLPGYQNSGMQWQLRELGFPHLDIDDENDEEIKIPKGLKVMLTFSGMAPFDVTRGLW